MIKVILKNGVTVECDTAQEATQVINQTHQREISGGGAKETKPKKEKKFRIHLLDKECIICDAALKGKSKQKKYCDSCRTKVTRETAKQYYYKTRNIVPVTQVA